MCDAAPLGTRRQRALDLLNVGDYHAAEPLLRELVEGTRGQTNELGHECAETFAWTRRLVESLLGQEEYTKARPLAQAAEEYFERRFGATDEDALDCKYLLAECLSGQGRHRDAEPVAQSAAEGLEQNFKRGPEHFTTLKCRAVHALALKAIGEHAEAKALARSTQARLDAAVERAETRAEQGSRRMSEPERLAMEKASALLAKVLTVPRKPKQDMCLSIRQTVSTDYPASDDGGLSEFGSRRPSKA